MKISKPALVAILCVYAILFLGIGSVVARKAREETLVKRVETSIGLSLPVSISIPAIGLQKEIMPGVYDFTAKSWTITSNYPHYATISPAPNTVQGNTVIYAHNTNSLFGRLNSLSRGSTVTVTTKSGTTYTYAYVSSADVAPEDVRVFNNDGSARLTLITCIGKENSRRLLVLFTLVSKI